MRYFIFVLGERKISLHRVDLEQSPPILERWTGEMWVFAPSVLDAVSGYSSDADNYLEVSEAEAEEFRTNFKKEK